MSSVAKVLKEQMSLISHRKARAVLAPTRKLVIKLTETVTQLGRRVLALEKDNRRLQRLNQDPAAAVANVEIAGVRFTTKGIKSLRRRLGLSQENLGLLLGTTAQSVYLWERKRGALTLRARTRTALSALQRMPAKEAQERLQVLRTTPPVPTPRKQR